MGPKSKDSIVWVRKSPTGTATKADPVPQLWNSLSEPDAIEYPNPVQQNLLGKFLARSGWHPAKPILVDRLSLSSTSDSDPEVDRPAEAMLAN